MHDFKVEDHVVCINPSFRTFREKGFIKKIDGQIITVTLDIGPDVLYFPNEIPGSASRVSAWMILPKTITLFESFFGSFPCLDFKKTRFNLPAQRLPFSPEKISASG